MNATAQAAGSTLRPAAAYRQLVMRGLAPGEAANITAVMRGIPIGETPWTVREISHLLFLRAMSNAGRFGPDDGVGRDSSGDRRQTSAGAATTEASGCPGT